MSPERAVCRHRGGSKSSPSGVAEISVEMGRKKMIEPNVDVEVCCGILVEGEPIPLQGGSVEATIKDFCSRVTITQRYRHQE